MNAKALPGPRRHYTRRDFLRVAGAGFAAAASGGLLAACRETRLARKLRVSPATVKVDEPFAIILKNLSPWQRVTLRARFVDGYDVEWTSKATFRADFGGTVDVARQSPVEGSYTGKEPMGLVWSANSQGASYAISLRPQPLFVTAETEGEKAGVRVVRNLLTDEIVCSDVRERGLYGRFFRPASGGCPWCDRTGRLRRRSGAVRDAGGCAPGRPRVSRARAGLLLRRLAARQARGHPRRYPDAGHGIQPPYLPATPGTYYYGGDIAGNAAANEDSWRLVLRTLDARLRR